MVQSDMSKSPPTSAAVTAVQEMQMEHLLDNPPALVTVVQVQQGVGGGWERTAEGGLGRRGS